MPFADGYGAVTRQFTLRQFTFTGGFGMKTLGVIAMAVAFSMSMAAGVGYAQDKKMDEKKADAKMEKKDAAKKDDMKKGDAKKADKKAANPCAAKK